MPGCGNTVVGVKGTFNQIPKDVFLKFVPKGGEELAEMLEYFQDYGCTCFSRMFSVYNT